MKSVRKNLLTPGSWHDLANLAGGHATTEQKLLQISRIIGHFPERRFVLVGDSGEHDPEVYRDVRDRFPDQIEAIWIRDVVDDRHRNPERLKGMQIIDGQYRDPQKIGDAAANAPVAHDPLPSSHKIARSMDTASNGRMRSIDCASE